MIRWAVVNLLGFEPLSRDQARDWTAILYTPVLTAGAVGLVLIIWLGPWPDATAPQRLNFLGWSLLGLLGLIGLGTFFLQRRTVDIRGTLPGGATFEIDDVSMPDIPKP